jgi:hypothetical protein
LLDRIGNPCSAKKIIVTNVAAASDTNKPTLKGNGGNSSLILVGRGSLEGFELTVGE